MKISERKYEEQREKPIQELETMNSRDLNTLLLEIFDRRSKTGRISIFHARFCAFDALPFKI